MTLSRLTIVAGSTLYAHVDSVNFSTDYGAVLEGHELRGGAYNNITATGAVGPVSPPASRRPPSAGGVAMPPR